MNIQMILALVAILIALAVLFVPNKYIDTSSCKRNWCVILTILSGTAFLTKLDDIGWIFLSLLFLGIFINYAFPFLLNVYMAFNRKSDP